jgi:hypothetical protein
MDAGLWSNLFTKLGFYDANLADLPCIIFLVSVVVVPGITPLPASLQWQILTKFTRRNL